MRLLLVALAAALLPSQAPDTAASRAGFFAGCWETVSATRTIREEWRAVTPDFLIGMGSTAANGKMSEFEFLRVESKAGVVDYVAQPNGAPPTRFTLDPKSPADEAIFVNMQHDFPKRVGYRKVNADAVTAWIDGGEGTRKIEFPYKRCK